MENLLIFLIGFSPVKPILDHEARRMKEEIDEWKGGGRVETENEIHSPVWMWSDSNGCRNGHVLSSWKQAEFLSWI